MDSKSAQAHSKVQRAPRQLEQVCTFSPTSTSGASAVSSALQQKVLLSQLQLVRQAEQHPKIPLTNASMPIAAHQEELPHAEHRCSPLRVTRKRKQVFPTFSSSSSEDEVVQPRAGSPQPKMSADMKAEILAVRSSLVRSPMCNDSLPCELTMHHRHRRKQTGGDEGERERLCSRKQRR